MLSGKKVRTRKSTTKF